MSLTIVQNLLLEFNEQEFCGGVSLKEVKKIEKELGVKFPNDYIEYLTTLGCGYASSEDFFGLGGEINLNIVNRVRHLQAESTHAHFPSHLIPLRPDGYGNYDCIDLRLSSTEQSTIILWLHDEKEKNNYEVIGKSLWEWFLDELKSVKEFDSQV